MIEKERQEKYSMNRSSIFLRKDTIKDSRKHHDEYGIDFYFQKQENANYEYNHKIPVYIGKLKWYLTSPEGRN